MACGEAAEELDARCWHRAEGSFEEDRNVVRGYVNIETDTLDTPAELAKGWLVLQHGGVVEVRPFSEGVPALK